MSQHPPLPSSSAQLEPPPAFEVPALVANVINNWQRLGTTPDQSALVQGINYMFGPPMTVETDEFKRRRAFTRATFISLLSLLSLKPEWVEFLFTSRAPSDDSPMPGYEHCTQFEHFYTQVGVQIKSLYVATEVVTLRQR